MLRNFIAAALLSCVTLSGAAQAQGVRYDDNIWLRWRTNPDMKIARFWKIVQCTEGASKDAIAENMGLDMPYIIKISNLPDADPFHDLAAGHIDCDGNPAPGLTTLDITTLLDKSPSYTMALIFNISTCMVQYGYSQAQAIKWSLLAYKNQIKDTKRHDVESWKELLDVINETRGGRTYMDTFDETVIYSAGGVGDTCTIVEKSLKKELRAGNRHPMGYGVGRPGDVPLTPVDPSIEHLTKPLI